MKRTLLACTVLGAVTCTSLLISGCQIGTTEKHDSSTPVATAAADLSEMDIYQAKPSEAVIFYKRVAGDYEGWGLHLWDGDGRTNGVNELL